jgi:CHAT domain-containing protein
MLSLADLRLSLEQSALRPIHRDGSLVCQLEGAHNFVGEPAELVFELYQTVDSPPTPALGVYLVKVDVRTETSVAYLRQVAVDIQSQTGGEVMLFIEGNTVGLSWFFMLDHLDSNRSLPDLLSGIAERARSVLLAVSKRKGDQLLQATPNQHYDLDNEALLEILRDPQHGDFKSVELLSRARRAVKRLLAEVDVKETRADWITWTGIYADLSGTLYFKGGNHEEASEAENAYRQVLDYLNGESRATSELNLGVLLRERFDRSADERYAERAELAFKKALETTTAPVRWASCQHRLGQLFAARYKLSGGTKDSHAAEAAYLRALEVLSKEESPRRWASIMHSLGNLYSHWYDDNRDEKLASKAEQVYREALLHRSGDEKAYTLFALGVLASTRYSKTEDETYAEPAEEALKAALAYWDRHYNPIYATMALRALGGLFVRRYAISGESDVADKGQTILRRCRKIYAEATLTREGAHLELELAGLLKARYENTRITHFADEATAILRDLLKDGGGVDLLSSRDLMEAGLMAARLCADQGGQIEASHFYSMALARGREHYLGAVGYEDQIAIAGRNSFFHTEHALHLAKSGDALGALLTADDGRAVSLAARIGADAQLYSTSPSAHFEELRIERERLRILERKWHGVDAGRTQMEWMTLRSKLRESRNRVSELSSELGLGISGLSRETLVSSTLPGDTAVVELVSGTDEAWALCWRGRQSVEAVRLSGLDLSTLAERCLVPEKQPFRDWLSAYHERLTAPTEWYRAQSQVAKVIADLRPGWDFLVWLRHVCTLPEARQAAEAMFADLIGNVLAALRRDLWQPVLATLSDVAHIVLVPSGHLTALPIVSAAPSSVDVTLSPSVYLWLRTRSVHRENEDSLLFVLPTYGEDAAQLPFASLELIWVASQFADRGIPYQIQGGNISSQQILESVGSASYLHFAGHAVFNQSDPLQSGLLCSAEGDNLTLQRLRDTDAFRRTRLVVLSACSTGKSMFMLPTGIGVEFVADEFVGLPAGLIEAGAHAVIGSLWPVGDVSAGFLMRAFYRQLCSGESVERSLRRACDWLKSARKAELKELIAEAHLRSGAYSAQLKERLQGICECAILDIESLPCDPPFESPVHWAAFTCFGSTFRERSQGSP